MGVEIFMRKDKENRLHLEILINLKENKIALK